jgi:hypothetical protein
VRVYLVRRDICLAGEICEDFTIMIFTILGSRCVMKIFFWYSGKVISTLTTERRDLLTPSLCPHDKKAKLPS